MTCAAKMPILAVMVVTAQALSLSGATVQWQQCSAGANEILLAPNLCSTGCVKQICDFSPSLGTQEFEPAKLGSLVTFESFSPFHILSCWMSNAEPLSATGWIINEVFSLTVSQTPPSMPGRNVRESTCFHSTGLPLTLELQKQPHWLSSFWDITGANQMHRQMASQYMKLVLYIISVYNICI